jgi:hypothetical protein
MLSTILCHHQAARIQAEEEIEHGLQNFSAETYSQSNIRNLVGVILAGVESAI